MKQRSSQHSRPYGVGIAYRFVVHDDIMKNRDSIDLLEIPTEDYIIRERALAADPTNGLLREALDTFPSVAHGISLSLGTVEKPTEHYLSSTRRFLEEQGLEIFSEHLAFHSVDGNDLTMFLAMPFEEESISWVKEKYRHVSRHLNRPFALENVTYHFPVPHASLSEADFFRRIGEELDCSFLLDVTNVFNNSHNHGYDPFEYLDRYPLERVSQIHLAGGHKTEDGTWEDSHSSPVMEPVWPLFEEVVRRTKCEIVILERDSKYNPFATVQKDIDIAREIFFRHRPARPEGNEPFTNELSPQDPNVHEVDLDPLAPKYAQLRAFQRSLMARIADPEFAAEFDRDPFGASATWFGLTDPDWQRRLIHCDPGSVHMLHECFKVVLEQEAEIQDQYESSEWAAWASQLAEENEGAGTAA